MTSPTINKAAHRDMTSPTINKAAHRDSEAALCHV
jgi:hypothetical protein